VLNRGSGFWLVELAPLQDEELLPSTVATTLWLGDRATESTLDRLSKYLADKHMLLVLDNCEHVINGCALLADKLVAAASKLRIPAASRQPLCIAGEHLLAVRPLSVPDPDAARSVDTALRSEAAQLFVEHAT
jgi:predicted ATPase